jgi:hypothetical protein
LAVGAIEAHAAGGEFVDIRRFDERMIIAAQRYVQIIDGDEENVEFGCGREQGRYAQAEAEKDE